MGKWATYQKRGSAPFFGTIPQFPLTGFSVTLPTVNGFTVGRTTPIPEPADSYGARFRTTAGGAWVNTAQSTGNIVVNTAASLTDYTVQAAWFKGTVQLSDWSPVRTITTT